jgi:membrane-associated protein
MKSVIEFILHIDKYMIEIINQFGLFTYLIIFLIIFAETGFVVTPFLPGDSLIFVLGALAAKGSLNIFICFIVLATAAVSGDALNYYIGHKVGRKAFRGKHFFKEENLIKTELFYEKHGGKTIILARFIPIVRTFAPFVAGIGKMNYRKFFSYNIVGGVLWVTLFLFGGYFFGNIPAVRNNFTFVILAIITLSVLPAVYHWAQSKFLGSKEVKVDK